MSGKISEIDFYFDPVSPFSYLATTQIERLAGRHGVETRWRPVLIGITVLKVMGLKPVPLTPLKSTYSWLDAQRQAKIFGVPLRRHGLKDVNSLAACRAYLWLAERDRAAAKRLAARLSAALWTEGRDITAAETVIAAAELPEAETRELDEALRSEGVKKQLAQEVEQAIERGVFGVPFFFADGEPLWGCDRLWMLDHLLAHGEWPRPTWQS